ncbi:MAG: tetratricopeptide repeat protein [Planctomycetota bacterium]|nr:tetratricopeptide repeat protein [Planctomycetota bacterium]
MFDEDQLLAMLTSGQEVQVRAMLESHLKKRPADAVANKVMAMIHGAHMEDDKALPYLQRAAYAAPRDGQIRFMLANVLLGLRKYKESLAAYKECLKLAPGDVAGTDGAGKCLISLGKLDEGRKMFESAIAANPNVADAYGNYATALVQIGKAEEGLEVARRGLERLPENASLLEFVAYTSNFPHNVDNRFVKEVHERWGRAIARERAGVGSPRIHGDRSPDRALRVGFLSGDFTRHACALFMAPAIRGFDQTRIIPYCYSTTHVTDGGDQLFRACAPFRELAEATLDQTAAAIAADSIDILIDCSGLTQGQRLRSMIPRCAPVQATWLGYPNTTGVATIDWRIVDAQTDPSGSEWQCSERIARIEGCFLCFSPDRDAPEPVPTPAVLNPDEPVIFGSFNRMTKVNAQTLDAWAAVLKAVPSSKMLVKLRIMSDELLREAQNHFVSRGVEASRIIAVPFTQSAQEHALMYGRMDVALDAFPYNGTTTTCEASWMGVPVIVLAGDSHRSRVGVSLNTALGQTDLIASDVDEYVKIAQKLAADRAALGRRKLGLRAAMNASILCDDAGYARRFEQTLRSMWQDCCNQGR